MPVIRFRMCVWCLLAFVAGVETASAQDIVRVGPGQTFTDIQSAVDHALDNKENFVSTEIIIEAGTYRESFVMERFINWPTNDPDNLTPITIRGEGEVIVKGSDVLTGWANTSGNRWEHIWLNDWGLGTDPTGGATAIEDIVRRREIVFVDGVRLKQVMTEAELVDETYWVDEFFNDFVVVTQADLSTALVEVGFRDKLYVQEWESNVTIDNIQFMHAPTAWNDTDAAVKINGATDFTILNTVFRENNAKGLFVTSIDGVYIENVQMNDNGWNGWATWRVTDFVARNTETSRNNWRGDLGGFYVWNVGNKILAAHGVDIRNHIAVDNFSRGLWLDLDITNALLDSMIITGNLSDGMFIEANQGPITISNSDISNNGGDAILLANSDSVTLVDNTFIGNANSWLRFSGSSGGRTVTDFETGIPVTLFSENWTLLRNTVEVTNASESIIFNQILATAFDRFVNTLTADENTYIHTGTALAFHTQSNEDIDFAAWQAFSGVDANSTFSMGQLTPPTASFSASILGLTANLDAAASTDDGSIVDFDWDFGDGSLGSGVTTSHTYSSEGTYSVQLVVTDDDGLTDTISQDVTVGGESASVTVLALFAGSYAGGGLMRTDLNAAGLIPLSQPYSDPAFAGTPRAYAGTESVVAIPNANVVDWVLVELRTDVSAASTVARRAGFILNSGIVRDLDGVTPLQFSGVPDGNYYVVVRHRNHIGVMSSFAVQLFNGSMSIDFTNNVGKAFGTEGLVQLESGQFGLYSGDADGDEEVGAGDDTAWVGTNGIAGYLVTDFNLSGGSTAADNVAWSQHVGVSTNIPD